MYGEISANIIFKLVNLGKTVIVIVILRERSVERERRKVIDTEFEVVCILLTTE